MEFKVTLKRKTMEGTEAVLNFVPVDNTVCDCDSIITKVPIAAQGYFVGNEYIVTITPFVVEVAEEPVA